MSGVADLAVETHTASVGIIGWAGRNGDQAGPGDVDLILDGGGGGLRGSNCPGKDQGDNERTDEMFHSEIPLKLYSQIKIFVDNQMR